MNKTTKELSNQFNITEAKRALKDLKKAKNLILELSQFTNRLKTKRRLTSIAYDINSQQKVFERFLKEVK